MTEEAPDLERVREGLESAVAAAAEAIVAVMGQERVRVAHKFGEGPVTEADHAADDVLHERLMPLVAGAQWLSEESRQATPLLGGRPTWVVDPLDGTREFLRGLPEFGVSAGLFVEDRLVLGAVALPVQREVLSGLLAGERREARHDGAPFALAPHRDEARRVVVSRHDYEHRAIQRHIPHEVYPCGSAAVKLAHAARGQADVYLSTGPRMLWDVAGGTAVLRAAGGELLTHGGRVLELSPRRVHVPPYAAGQPEACLALLRRLGEAGEA